MLTLYDYLPSQNAWKVRQILRHIDMTHRTEIISIFEGQGQDAAFLGINPWGAVPAIELDDGRVLSESNAILWFLGERVERLRPVRSSTALSRMMRSGVSVVMAGLAPSGI